MDSCDGSRSPGHPATADASPIDYGAIHFANYDLILVFGPLGQLVGAFGPAEVRAVAVERRLSPSDPLALVASIRSKSIPEGKATPEMLDEKTMPPK